MLLNSKHVRSPILTILFHLVKNPRNVELLCSFDITNIIALNLVEMS